ncbi:hypothetical protein AB1L42_05360 [Thalassoglobus sp. JC818]|uniref:hypothetical protein n=1 Tax=Thalassoglobus sp. JC818 TaxID=3232136 RepID=UPI00345A15A1
MSKLDLDGCGDLNAKQFNMLVRKLGGFSRKPILDVSDGSDDWVVQLSRRGGTINGIADRADETDSEIVAVGSPAASIRYSTLSMHRVLIRNNSAFLTPDVTPESTIALANLLSCLKPGGKLVIPIKDVDRCQCLWTRRLEGFPGTLKQRQIKTGMLDYLSFAFLFSGIHSLSVLEFTIGRKPLSRLQWHRFAREAVMNRSTGNSAAA